MRSECCNMNEKTFRTKTMSHRTLELLLYTSFDFTKLEACQSHWKKSSISDFSLFESIAVVFRSRQS